MKLLGKAYIHQRDDDGRGRVDGEGLERLHHVVDVLLVEQSAEDTCLEIDHILRFRDARVERLLSRRCRRYFGVREELSQIERRELVDSVHDQIRHAVVAVEQVNEGVQTLAHQRRGLRSGVQQQAGGSHHHTRVNRHQQLLGHVEQIDQILVQTNMFFSGSFSFLRGFRFRFRLLL